MFFGKARSNMYPWINFSHIKFFILQIYLSNEVWCASNGDRMPKLCPGEVDIPIYPNWAHSFGASSPRVMLLDV